MSFGSSAQAGSEWESVATVISRSLAFLCLQSTSLKEGTMLQKAQFLSGLGLPYSDAAEMLGSSEASLKELARLARKSRGAKRGKPGKSKRGRR
jgi:DNA-directed RNA polymerase specialized sigma24 family protein